MLTAFKYGWRAWMLSFGVLARSPIYVIALAAVAGLWGYAGYEWLWLPESSWLVLALALVWILALAALAFAALSGTVSGVSAVASGADQQLSLRRILSIERVGRMALIMLAALVGGFVLDELFGWINDNALPIASFLTFHLQHPISQVVIGGILRTIEGMIWVAFACVVMVRLLSPSSARNSGSPASAGEAPPPFLSMAIFLTGILSAAVFGGLAWLLAGWRPIVKPGAWDYVQLVVRNGVALLLLTLGWLFWALTLARLAISPKLKPAERATRQTLTRTASLEDRFGH